MSAAERPTEYAFWEVPEKSFHVRYPLGLFHEIDFQVNEAFRSIPHGGVETGGVFWGQMTADSITIVTFRRIQCDHAAGPSFVLSDADLARLADQLRAAETDEELTGLLPVGCYVSHTRGALAMNDRDAALLDRFFPEPGQVLLVMKPEKFQPTRFAFVVREADGRVDRNSAEHAFILPLPGRASGSGSEAVASIPAPARSKVPTPEARTTPEEVTTVAMPENRTLPETVPSKPAALRDSVTEAAAKPITQSELPSVEEIRKRREKYVQPVPLPEPKPSERDATRPLQRPSRWSLRFAAVLVIAALLGCAAGYWAYLQLPAAIIPVSVEKRPKSLLVSWPPEQTRSTAYAAIRVDDGQAVPLTSDQKDRGQFEVKTNEAEVKLELIAQHWLRDSRGIVRFVNGATPVPESMSAPTTPPGTTAGVPGASER